MPVRALDHALVLTDDVEETKAFYCDVLGFEVGERPPLAFPGYWLTLDGVACLHVAERAAYEAHAAEVGLGLVDGAIDHLAFAAEGHDALAARLEAAGVEVVTNEVPAAGIRQLFVADPNGVRIELNLATGSGSPGGRPERRESR
jgi:catechol 2,3-dioxygenase-like lactoylglutathione lyase family enzyme